MKNPNRLICLALALLVLSCNEDDLPNTSAENLIVMKAFYFRHNGPEKQTIVVTDPDGKVLSTLKSTYWVDTPIKPTLRGYHGNLVNVYLIDRYDSYYGISAFLNLKRGSEFVGPLYEYNYPGVEPSRLKLRNVEPFDHLTFSTDLVGASITQLADTFSLLQNAHIEAGQAYGQLVSNGQGYYGFFDMDKESGMATLDRAGMNKPSSKFTIKLAPEVTYSNFSLVGSFDAASQGWGYQLFSTIGKSQFDIYYPEEPFAKYFSSLSYYANERLHTIQRVTTSLDFNYEDITFNGVIANASPRNFRMDISGQFDYYVASYTSTSFNTYLTVYSSQRYGNFSIPDFSDIMGNEKFPFADLSWLHLEMLDHDGVQENDEDFKFFTSGKFPWPRDSRTVGMGMPLK